MQVPEDIDYYQRQVAEKSLKAFLNQKSRAGLVFLRGRRRVGKSSLLKHIQKNNKQVCFYFTGVRDESAEATILRFVRAWDEFTGKKSLSILSNEYLSWTTIFEKIAEETRQNSEQRWIFLDEIQWLARAQSGFVGLFKEAWLSLEQNPKIKIVLCGSSNKFFVDHVGGEEKILRGMVTHADIWLSPLTPFEVRKYYAQDLSEQEAIFLYFCFGGIPYYLNRFDFRLGFIRGFNDAVMTAKSIFPNEINEVLNLDFNNKGLPTVKKLFASFSSRFATFESLKVNGRFAASTLSQVLEKLVQYNLVKELSDFDQHIKLRRRNVTFYYTDFFTHFYMKVLYKNLAKIRKNESSNLFSGLLTSNKNLYIENFSGAAFENFVQYCIENLDSKHSLIQEFDLSDESPILIDNSQSDLVFQSPEEKLMRYIECKWTSNLSLIEEGLAQLSKVEDIDGYKAVKYLAVGYPVSTALLNKAHKLGVKIVDMTQALVG